MRRGNVGNVKKVTGRKFDWSNNSYVKHSRISRQVKAAVKGFWRSNSF